MKVEFIIDKSEYKKLLDKGIIGAQIKHNSEKVRGKNNYLLTLLKDGKNVTTAKALSDSRISIEKLFSENNVKYRLLTEEASQFFVQRLYPCACEFETKLRKFIYIALFDLDDTANELAIKIYNSTMGIKKENKLKSLPNYDFLSEKELHEIFDFLFANDEFLSQVKNLSLTNNLYQRHKTKNELLKELSLIEDTSIWAQIFKPFFSDSILPEIYSTIQQYRNSIMHFHNMNYQDYISIQKLFRKAIKDLDSQIDKGIVIEDTKSNTSVLAGCLTFLIAFMAEISVFKSQFISGLQPTFDAYAKVQEQTSVDLFKIREQQKIINDQLKTDNNHSLREEISELVKTHKKITVPKIKTDEIKVMSENLRKIAMQTKRNKKIGE